MPTPVKNEPNRLSDWLVYEEDELGRYSRENVTVAASQTLVTGSPVGLDGSGNVVEYDDAGPDGDVCVGILVEPVTTGVGETKPGVIIARHARISADNLTWKTGLAAPAKAAALVDLKGLGVHNVRSV